MRLSLCVKRAQWLALGVTSIVVHAATYPTASTYTLIQDYDTSQPVNFFEAFDFFTAPDPTHGSVQYQSMIAANTQGLIGSVSAAEVTAGSVSSASIAARSHNSTATMQRGPQRRSSDTLAYMGVDTTSISAPGGRASVRISSLATFQPGMLLVADIAHLPVGCGTWPALWLLGASAEWPYAGEVDVIEQVNDSPTNSVALHTGPGCSVAPSVSSSNASAGASPWSVSPAFSGTLVSSNCDSANGFNGNEGCVIDAPAGSNTFGSGFNAMGGGIYAMAWDATGIATWFWPHNSPSTPPSVSEPGATLDTSGFGTPLASFTGSACDWETSFSEMQLVLNTALCGDWAGSDAVWESSGCAAQTGVASCAQYIEGDVGGGLDEAYWLIRGLRVYSGP